jgi:hypothetical protein
MAAAGRRQRQVDDLEQGDGSGRATTAAGRRQAGALDDPRNVETRQPPTVRTDTPGTWKP